jgi:hypothetical protein
VYEQHDRSGGSAVREPAKSTTAFPEVPPMGVAGLPLRVMQAR